MVDLQRGRGDDDLVWVHGHWVVTEVHNATEAGLAGEVEDIVGRLVPRHRPGSQGRVAPALSQQSAVEGQEGRRIVLLGLDRPISPVVRHRKPGVAR